MRFRVVTILLLLPLLLSLTSCSSLRGVTLYPIDKVDIYKVPAGATITIPAGTVMKNDKGEIIAKWDSETKIVNERDGRFLSNFYIVEVMNAKVSK